MSITTYPPDPADYNNIATAYGNYARNVFPVGQPITLLLWGGNGQVGAQLYEPLPTSWTCYDINGTSWSGTAVFTDSGQTDTHGGDPLYQCTITPPPGKSQFDNGWYRVWFMGSYTNPEAPGQGGEGTFMVVSNDSNFPVISSNTEPTQQDGDIVAATLAAVGPERYQVQDVYNYLSDATTVAAAATASKSTYYAHYASTNRPRPLFLQFPNGSVDCMAIWDDTNSRANGVMASGNLLLVDYDMWDGIWFSIVSGTNVGTVKFQICNTATPSLAGDYIAQYDNLTTWGDIVNAINNDVTSGVSNTYVTAETPNPSGAATTLAITSIRRVGEECAFNIVNLSSSPSWIQLAAGTSSGVKVTISQPKGTVVETYDNLLKWSNVTAAINASSTRVYAFSSTPNATAQQTPQMKIIADSFNGVKSTVALCYPAGVTVYEGPWNEPQGGDHAFVAAQARGFKAAVKAGNASAKVMGPNPVSFNSGSIGWLQSHLADLPANFYDIISVHGYNTTNGDLALSDKMLTNFKAMLSTAGYGSTPIWMTEAGIMTETYGIAHWRRSAHWTALWYLVYEAYGIPKEQQSYFYINSRGFWDFPSFSIADNKFPAPQFMFWRGLSERIYNSTFQSRLTFSGAAADAVLGIVFAEPGVSQTVALVSVGMPTIAVTLAISGVTSVNVYDWAGNRTVQKVGGGQVTILVSDLTTYVVTSAAATISVVDVNGGLDKAGQNLVQASSKTFTETVSYKDGSNSGALSYVGNNLQEVDYTESGDTVLAYRSKGPFPHDVKFTLPSTTTVRRMLIICAPPWQYHSTLRQFHVDTWNGSVWVTQFSYTSPNMSTVSWVSPYIWGTVYETYWDEQWMWDITFSAPVSTTEVRIVVQSGSNGGEVSVETITNFGQGWSEGVNFREIKIY